MVRRLLRMIGEDPQGSVVAHFNGPGAELSTAIFGVRKACLSRRGILVRVGQRV